MAMNVKFTDRNAGGLLVCGTAALISVRTVTLFEAISDSP